MLPADFPAVEANELRIDQLFLLEDGSVALIDYESEYSKKNIVKYLRYVPRIFEKWLKEHGDFPEKLRLIVIYTADVKRSSTKRVFDQGAIRVELQEGFLSELDGDQITADIERKIKAGEPISDKDIMLLIILPLTYREKDRQNKAVERIIDLTDQVPDPVKSGKIMAGMVTFANHIITKEMRTKIYGRLKMTFIDQMFAEEMQEALDQRAEEVTREVTKSVTASVTQNVTKEIAEKFLQKGVSLEEVSECTNLPLETVRKLADEIFHTAGDGSF
jgi:hypothetical protein